MSEEMAKYEIKVGQPHRDCDNCSRPETDQCCPMPSNDIDTCLSNPSRPFWKPKKSDRDKPVEFLKKGRDPYSERLKRDIENGYVPDASVYKSTIDCDYCLNMTDGGENCDLCEDGSHFIRAGLRSKKDPIAEIDRTTAEFLEKGRKVKADNGLCVYRDFETNHTTVFVQKIRFREIGKLGECGFKYRHTGNYKAI